MPKAKPPEGSSKVRSVSACLDTLVEALGPFDFGVDADDFILYELNRFIEEDRASFEEEEFRILIDEGIRVHVEENLSIRCKMAYSLRGASRGLNAEAIASLEQQLGVKFDPGIAEGLDPTTRAVAVRIAQALENTDSDLRNVAFVVRKYTAYLFERLQSIERALPGEAESLEMIESWKSGAIPREQLITNLQQLGRASLGPSADLLLNSTDDRNAAETALSILSHIRSSVSARVLAFVVSEPVLDEDLEARAYAALREFWPLARPYILHSLHLHAHEDLPFRWFQLLLEADEVTTSELVYEEMRTHGSLPNYREDLWALASLLVHSRDPEIEDKVLAWINSPQTPGPVVPMLQEFLKEYRRPDPKPDSPDPWTERERLRKLNERYVAASKLLDAGHTAEARMALDKILSEEPYYPFAFMLKRISNG